MPYKCEQIKIAGTGFDRRIKLTDQERLDIKNAKGVISQRKLADMYGVSKRLIQFIQSPEKLEENIKRRKERGADYYDKDKHRDYMRDHRQYKQGLYVQGKIN